METIYERLEEWIEYTFSLDNFISLLQYDPTNPFIFTKLPFWIFLVLILPGFALVAKRTFLRNVYLMIVSMFFYYKTSGLFVLILVFSTVSDYFLGLFIHNADKQWLRRIGVAMSVFINLFVLSYFKYAYFFVDVLNQMFDTHFVVFNWFAHWANEAMGTHFEVGEILLPVGISFYTFQTISYSVDVYRGHVQPVRNILDFAFYVSFFPQLVAGPIVRASEFVPQLYKPFKLSKQEFGFANYMIMKGLIKKMIFGDLIAVNFIDRVFANPTMFGGFENVMAAFGYSLQVYADFSGYTDIAIGIAKLFGFDLPKNFNYPYKAQNVGEFWKRWHMSLSNWLKDYLYIPLGGNRHGSVGSLIVVIIIAIVIFFLAKNQLWIIMLLVWTLVALGLLYIYPSTRRHVTTNINLMLTMLLGGLWHGASWNFVIWGGLNGLGLVIYKYWRKISPFTGTKNPIAIVFAALLTFTFITFTRFWFRAPDTQTVDLMFHQIINHFDTSIIPEVIKGYWIFFSLFALGMFLHWLPQKVKDSWLHFFENAPFIVHVIAFFITVIIVYQAAAAGLQPFIYFQF